jgi:hypothetical protein
MPSTSSLRQHREEQVLEVVAGAGDRVLEHHHRRQHEQRRPRQRRPAPVQPAQQAVHGHHQADAHQERQHFQRQIARAQQLEHGHGEETGEDLSGRIVVVELQRDLHAAPDQLSHGSHGVELVHPQSDLVERRVDHQPAHPRIGDHEQREIEGACAPAHGLGHA